MKKIEINKGKLSLNKLEIANLDAPEMNTLKGGKLFSSGSIIEDKRKDVGR